MNKRNGGTLIGLSVVFIIMVSTALAWACTRQVSISISPKAGPAGTAILVNGSGFNPGSPVEIRWNSTDGQKLGEAPAGPVGSFSLSVQAPQAVPEIYDIIAQQADPVQGLLRSADRFTLRAAGSQSEQVSDGGARQATESRSNSEEFKQNGEAVPSTTGQREPPASTADSLPQRPGVTGQLTQPAGQASTGQAPPPAPVANSSQAVQASAGEALTPSERTLSQDLWGGFAKSRNSLAEAGLPAGPTSDSRAASLLAGLAMLALGTGALSFTVAAAHSRRRAASGPAR